MRSPARPRLVHSAGPAALRLSARIARRRLARVHVRRLRVSTGAHRVREHHDAYVAKRSEMGDLGGG